MCTLNSSYYGAVNCHQLGDCLGLNQTQRVHSSRVNNISSFSFLIVWSSLLRIGALEEKKRENEAGQSAKWRTSPFAAASGRLTCQSESSWVIQSFSSLKTGQLQMESTSSFTDLYWLCCARSLVTSTLQPFHTTASSTSFSGQRSADPEDEQIEYKVKLGEPNQAHPVCINDQQHKAPRTNEKQPPADDDDGGHAVTCFFYLSCCWFALLKVLYFSTHISLWSREHEWSLKCH